MNRNISDRKKVVGDVLLLRRQIGLVSVLVVLALLVMLVPLPDLDAASQVNTRLQVALEFPLVVLVVLVFATVWHTPAKEVSTSYLLIAIALLASGWLDFGDAILFQGPFGAVGALAAEKSNLMRLLEGLVVATSLLVVGFFPALAPASVRLRVAIFAAFVVVNLLLFSTVFYADSLPILNPKYAWPMPLGVQINGLITALFAIAAWRAYWLAEDKGDDVWSLLFSAIALAGLSQALVSQSVRATDAHNLLGHTYKLLSYGIFYQAMFAVCVNRPYEKLTAQMQLRRISDQTLRNQGLALNATGTPVIVSDLQGKVLWRNRASLALLGALPKTTATGLSLFAAPITPDPLVAQRMQDTLTSTGVWEGLIYLRDQQGNEVVLDQTVTLVHDENSAPHGYIAVAENVTQRELAQLRYKRVLDMSIDGFWVADAVGQFQEVNEAYARMSGYSVDELLTMHISELESPKSSTGLAQHMAKIRSVGKHQFETQLRHKNGQEFTVDLSVIYDPEHALFFTFVRDRTEMVQAAAARKVLERQLQQSQKVEQLGQLTGGIAHDFNNNLATILGYSRLALERFVPDRQSKLADYLGEVIGASERARDLIAKMLTFAGTRPSLGAEVILPSAVVHEVVKMMRVSIPSSIQIKTWIEDDVAIRIDPSELSQVLVNLIINARDAIGEQGTIDLLLRQVEVKGQICSASHSVVSGTFAALEVSDTGKGIAAEHMPRLFDPFFTTKEVGKGTGLGLSMVQGIMRRSNGYVLVKSGPDGSWFQLLFPLAASPVSKTVPQVSKFAEPMRTGQRIWVVDDEPSVARYLGELLQEWGYRVRLFNHPWDLLLAFDAKQNDVDLVISDRTMPGLTGLALAQQLHRVQPELPIFLCSGYTDPLDQSEVLRHEILRYFMKPINPDELQAALAACLLTSKTLDGQEKLRF